MQLTNRSNGIMKKKTKKRTMSKLHEIHTYIVDKLNHNIEDVDAVKEILMAIEEYVVESKFDFMQYIRKNEPCELAKQLKAKEKLSNEIGEIKWIK